jgi:hypothetical protein
MENAKKQSEKKQKKRGFMDKCYLSSTVFVCLIVIASFVAVINSGNWGITDTSPLTSTIEKAFDLQMVFTGFIVWKAKTENCRKHKDVNRLKELEETVDELVV